MHDGGLSSEPVHEESGDGLSLLVLFLVTTVSALVVGEERPAVVMKLNWSTIEKTLQPVQLRHWDLRCTMYKVTVVGKYYDVIMSIGYAYHFDCRLIVWQEITALAPYSSHYSSVLFYLVIFSLFVDEQYYPWQFGFNNGCIIKLVSYAVVLRMIFAVTYMIHVNWLILNLTILIFYDVFRNLAWLIV